MLQGLRRPCASARRRCDRPGEPKGGYKRVWRDCMRAPASRPARAGRPCRRCCAQPSQRRACQAALPAGSPHLQACAQKDIWIWERLHIFRVHLPYKLSLHRQVQCKRGTGEPAICIAMHASHGERPQLRRKDRTAHMHAAISLACAAARGRVQQLMSAGIGICWPGQGWRCSIPRWGWRMRRRQAGSCQHRSSQQEGQHGLLHDDTTTDQAALLAAECWQRHQ